MPGVYLCEIVYKEKLTDSIYTISIVSDIIVEAAKAGQFLHIKCGKERMLRRPVSICCIRGSALEFVFEVKGEGTRWLSGREPGQTLDILGPLGNGFTMPDGNIVVVGGGIGTPPLLFAADSARGGVTAVLGFRDESKIILKREFESVCDKVYITTDDGSAGIHGIVTIPLFELLRNGGYSAVLACGPTAMLSAVSELCKSLNVPCQVSFEERMGCGVGACLVCACATNISGRSEMSRVCLDGPVFDATEVVWNR